ncbi:MAG: hypothetical protein EBR10_04245 [Planctomycetes bacterium]|nr:hypothetical protein [Planctomycetota bacterium]
MNRSSLGTFGALLLAAMPVASARIPSRIDAASATVAQSESVAGRAEVQPAVTPDPIILFDVLPSANSRERARIMGAQKFYVCYQSADPNAGKTGQIDSGKVVEAIRRETQGVQPEWGMLDFEDPFLDNLKKGPPSPEWKRTVMTMVALIQSVKTEFPRTKWTYYGVPNLELWMDGSSWDRLGDDDKRKRIVDAVATFEPITTQLDWVSPTVYGKYDPAMQTPSNVESTLRAERAWRVAQVGVARLCAGSKPVLPTIDPFWTPGGKAPFARIIPRRFFIEQQVVPTLEAGASGVAIWTAIEYFLDVAVQGKTPSGTVEPNFGPSEWRDALTKDFLGGQAPTDWSDPTVRQALVTGTSDSIARAMMDIKQWAAHRTMPPQ